MLKVKIGWFVHELNKFVDGKRVFRLGEVQILHGANDLTILGGISGWRSIM